MDLASFAVSFVISGVGYVAFSYGKRMGRPPPLAIGLVLMAYPYFVDSITVMVGVAVALLLLMFALVRSGW